MVGAITPWNYPLHQVVAKVGRGAGRRLHGGAQAGRADAAGRLPALRRRRRGRPAAGRGQPGAPAPGRWSARRSPPTRTSTWSRSPAPPRPARPIAHARRRPDRPGRAGAGRQVRQRDPRRRRPGQGGQGRRRQRVPQLRPDLHRVDPDAGAPQPLRRGGRRIAAAAAAGYPPGDPFDEGTRLGPAGLGRAARPRARLHRDRHRRRRPAGRRRPRTRRCRTAATSSRRPCSPTSTRTATVAQEEIFGPVLSIIPFDDDDEAVAIANNSRYGLAGGVWSADQDRALAVARRMRTGAVDINGGGVQPAGPVRRLQAVRHRPRARRARAGRVPARSRRSSDERGAIVGGTVTAALVAPAGATRSTELHLPEPGPGEVRVRDPRGRGLPLRPVHGQRHAARRRSRWCSGTRRPARWSRSATVTRAAATTSC